MGNTNWHGPFYDAMRLEFKDESGLDFQNEIILNTGPLKLDLLIIKKHNTSIIKNDIGKIFKKHNIFEYKSPNEQLGVDTYFKVMAYASLYKSNSEKENEIDSEDITISFVREGKPVKLIHWLENNECQLQCIAPGVYQLANAPLFKTQIIVAKELSKKEHLWLKALTKDINYDEYDSLVDEVNKIKDEKKKYTDSIMYLVHKELKNKEDDGMYEKMKSLYKDEINEMINNAVTEVNKEKDKMLAQRDNLLAQRDKRIEELEAELASLKKA